VGHTRDTRILRWKDSLEHHLLMTDPHSKLPRLHRLLSDRGLLDGALVTRG
jgi:fatty acid desaturase